MKTLLSFLSLSCLAALLFYSCQIPCKECPSSDGTEIITICEDDYESRKLFDAVIEAWETKYNVVCIFK